MLGAPGRSARSGLNRSEFRTVHIIPFRIAHDVSSGPLGFEGFHDFYGLFKQLTGCYVGEFAVSRLFKYSVHDSTSPRTPFWPSNGTSPVVRWI
jgi:hypothetical protein